MYQQKVEGATAKKNKIDTSIFKDLFTAHSSAPQKWIITYELLFILLDNTFLKEFFFQNLPIYRIVRKFYRIIYRQIFTGKF